MWCDRCAEQDRATLGTDEGHDHPQWIVLCDGCKTELDQDRAADALEAAEHQQRIQSHVGPVTPARTWRRRAYD